MAKRIKIKDLQKIAGKAKRRDYTISKKEEKVSKELAEDLQDIGKIVERGKIESGKKYSKRKLTKHIREKQREFKKRYKLRYADEISRRKIESGLTWKQFASGYKTSVTTLWRARTGKLTYTSPSGMRLRQYFNIRLRKPSGKRVGRPRTPYIRKVEKEESRVRKRLSEAKKKLAEYRSISAVQRDISPKGVNYVKWSGRGDIKRIENAYVRLMKGKWDDEKKMKRYVKNRNKTMRQRIVTIFELIDQKGESIGRWQAEGS